MTSAAAAAGLALVVAFLIGSVPFGYLIGRIFYRTDLRGQGSGNIGAMNALRTLGKTGGAAVLVLDGLKGFVPVFLAVRIGGPGIAAGIAAAAVLGHCFSPWLGWKGGKGVATSFGAIFGLSWAAGLVAAGGWIAGALLTQYSSVGSMLGSLLAPVALWIFTRSPAATVYGIGAALFVIYTHRENLARLRAGTEGPIRLFKRKP
ncbi:MAG TPA: glycerol-3-phosphate 1-O-acyltransferase PlsY [Candidatus Tumulicola sp.]